MLHAGQRLHICLLNMNRQDSGKMRGWKKKKAEGGSESFNLRFITVGGK